MEKLPPISKPLVDYIEASFPDKLPTNLRVSDSPDVVSSQVYYAMGQQSVIKHLRYLLHEVEGTAEG